MSVAKVIHIVSSSPESFDAAVRGGVATAARTVQGIRGVKVTDWTIDIADARPVHYKVTMDIAFAVDEG
jgi:flavin-binding protein dodecin